MASPPVEEWGRSGDLCESLHWLNTLTRSSCICFLSFPCFLSQHVSLDLPVMDVCSAAVSFDIFPPMAVDQTNSKTTANMGLLNGFPFCFVLSLCPHPPSPTFFLLFSVSPFLLCPYRCSRGGVREEV